MSDYISVNGALDPKHTKTWFDKNIYDPIAFKKKRGGKNEFGAEVEAIIPDAAEVRLLGNRHRQCKYYQIGVEVCHTQMLQQGADNFLACKQPIDAMWRCYTEDKYGASIRDAPDYTKRYEKEFYDCMFRDASGLDVCMRPFSSMIRAIHRSGESELNTDY